jgi:hypothetical protein
MKVKELLDTLQKLDPETLVLVDAYEGDYNTPKKVIETIVCEQHTEWYYGDYQICPNEDPAGIKAIYLPR